MEASKETFVVLPVSQYKQLQNKYEVHVKNITEEERRRRRWAVFRCISKRYFNRSLTFCNQHLKGGGSF